ncbi:MAG: fasciclin domain-containing protein, partial [Alphaproteobacteria bacterium]
AHSGVMVDKAKVVKADVEASNGVIHVIDTVIMPNM